MHIWFIRTNYFSQSEYLYHIEGSKKRNTDIRSDHPNNVKTGGACLYYKENLSLRSVNVPFLSQCVLCEVNLQSQKGYVIVIYRSPSQWTVEFDEFLSNSENLLYFVKGLKLSFTIILDDFNVLNHGG